MYKINLDNAGNPDYHQNPNRHLSFTFSGWLNVESILEARAIAMAYNQAFDLGGGNWSGGEIREVSNDRPVAYVSYNGRLWDISDGKKLDDYIPYVVSDAHFIAPSIYSIDRDLVMRTLKEKALAGTNCFEKSENWVSSNTPIYGSPLGFNINLYEGETGSWIVNIYSLKINNGERAVDGPLDSSSGYHILSDEDVALIKSAYAESEFSFLSSDEQCEKNIFESRPISTF